MDASSGTASTIEIGSVIGGCRILGLLGRGGMGAVYEAHQVSLDRKVAVKILQAPADLAERELQERFIREARLAARLNHPNIVQIYDVGREDEIHFMVMELVEGVTLKDILKGQPALALARLHRMALKVASALAAAHKAGIVHRDIKPENILLTSLGEVKLADFGAAALLSADGSSETNFATPAYAAPEVLRNETADGRADVYSLGLVLWRAAAGDYPFPFTDKASLFRAQIETSPAPLVERRPGIRSGLADLVGRMCAKKAADRPTSGEVLGALEKHPEWAGEGPVRRQATTRAEAPPPPSVEPAASGPVEKRPFLDAGLRRDLGPRAETRDPERPETIPSDRPETPFPEQSEAPAAPSVGHAASGPVEKKSFLDARLRRDLGPRAETRDPERPETIPSERPETPFPEQSEAPAAPSVEPAASGPVEKRSFLDAGLRRDLGPRAETRDPERPETIPSERPVTPAPVQAEGLPPASDGAAAPSPDRDRKGFLEAGLRRDLRAPVATGPLEGASAPERAAPPREAAPAREAAAAEDPRIAELCRKARFLVLKKGWKEAEARFREALAIHPACPMALLGLARVCVATNRAEEAVAILERAVEAKAVDPKEILEVPQLEPLRASKEFRRLLASHTI